MSQAVIKKIYQSPALWVVILAGFFSVLFFPHSDKLIASDKKLITVYVDGSQKTLVKNVANVEEALLDLGVEVEPNDVVEPAIDSRIDLAAFNINIYRARPVLVTDEGKTYVVYSAHNSPRLVANDADIDLYPEDEVVTDVVTDFIDEGFAGPKISVDRATAFKLRADGGKDTVRSQGKTVGDVLDEQNLVLREDDFVVPAANTHITDGMSVKVVRVGKEVVVEEKEIPFETKRITDYNLEFGVEEVKSEGQTGTEVIRFEVEKHDGKVVSKNKLSSKVTVKKENRVIVTGGKVPTVAVSGDKQDWMSAAGISQSDWGYADSIIFKESGWRYTAQNPSSGAYGLCQSLPGSKMASAGADWQTNPVTQLKWCNGYAQARYGSWSAAYGFWQNNRWW